VSKRRSPKRPSAARRGTSQGQVASQLQVTPSQAPAPTRPRVGEYAQSWIASKALRVDRTTARTYALALDRHILPALGDFFYDELTSRHVQNWIDDSIRRGWTAEAKGRKRGGEPPQRQPYTRSAMSVWLRTLRTMSRDAMAELDLPRDPTIRVELPRDDREVEQPKALTVAELSRFLEAFRIHHAAHYALVATLAFTGLRFCHASALRWEDWDEREGLLRIQRKQVRGKLGIVSRRKRAPAQYPVEPQLATILGEHRARIREESAELAATGWMFPSRTGTLRTPNTMDKSWTKALATAGITRRFTVHGLRYTFTDLIRRADVDAVVRRAMTGHVTEEMQRHYSHVDLAEKRAAMAGVFRLLPAISGD
jgi:integrase